MGFHNVTPFLFIDRRQRDGDARCQPDIVDDVYLKPQTADTDQPYERYDPGFKHPMTREMMGYNAGTLPNMRSAKQVPPSGYQTMTSGANVGSQRAGSIVFYSPDASRPATQPGIEK